MVTVPVQIVGITVLVLLVLMTLVLVKMLTKASGAFGTYVIQ